MTRVRRRVSGPFGPAAGRLQSLFSRTPSPSHQEADTHGRHTSQPRDRDQTCRTDRIQRRVPHHPATTPRGERPDPESASEPFLPGRRAERSNHLRRALGLYEHELAFPQREWGPSLTIHTPGTLPRSCHPPTRAGGKPARVAAARVPQSDLAAATTSRSFAMPRNRNRDVVGAHLLPTCGYPCWTAAQLTAAVPCPRETAVAFPLRPLPGRPEAASDGDRPRPRTRVLPHRVTPRAKAPPPAMRPSLLPPAMIRVEVAQSDHRASRADSRRT